MERHGTRIDGGTIYLETDDEPLEVGELGDVVDLVGGERYTITYEEDYAKAVDWLDLDEEQSMSFDVEETLDSMDFPRSFVDALGMRSIKATSEDGLPERTTYFVEVMTTIWDSKGSLEDLENNPFQ